MFDGAEFHRQPDGQWSWRGQVIAADDSQLRPKVAMLVSLAGRKIVSLEIDGDVARVTTEKKRPCWRTRGRR